MGKECEQQTVCCSSVSLNKSSPSSDLRREFPPAVALRCVCCSCSRGKADRRMTEGREGTGCGWDVETIVRDLRTLMPTLTTFNVV